VVAMYGRVVSNDEHIRVMNQVIRDAVAGKAAIAEAEQAKAQVQSLEAELIQVKLEAEKAAAPAQPRNLIVYVILALVGGLIIGGGVMFILRQR